MTLIRRTIAWCTQHRANTILIASFGAVALTFTAATVVAQLSSFQIHAAAQEITGNASPSIASLSAIRSCLRKVQLRIDDHLDECEREACRVLPDEISALSRTIRARWEVYKRLPTFPSEAGQWPPIEAAFDEIDRDMDEVVRALQRGDTAAATARFRVVVEPVFDRADGLVDGLIAHEHDQGIALTRRIDALARHSVVLALLLDVLSVALTIGTAALAVRLVRREERLLEQRAEELDRFAGQVSHEILNPLCAIDASVHVLQGGNGASTPALARIADAVGFIRHLVRGLLEFARSSDPRNSNGTSSVMSVVDEVVARFRPLADREGVELVYGLAPSAIVGCSHCVLTTILSNLVSNAIKHLGAADRRIVEIRAGACAPGCARIEVADTGLGVDPAVRDRVFEPFVRGSKSATAGFGLGLTTVKRLAAGHGGRVGFAPEPGGGTCFWVELPTASPAPLPVPATAAPRDLQMI